MSKLIENSAKTLTVKFFSDPIALANDLADLRGHQFMSSVEVFNMTETDNSGKLKRMLKGRGNPNPWLDSNLVKVSKKQLTVNFDYEKKVESRGGEQPVAQGNWIQAVIVNGRVTPLATHKADIVTVLETDKTKATLGKNGEIDDCVANRRAVLNEAGTVQFVTDTPRLYLRYEIVRDGGDENRQDRTMRSSSVYLTQTDFGWQEVDKADVEPWLPSKSGRTDETDFQVTGLDNIYELKAGGVIYRKSIMSAQVASILTTV